MKKTRLTRTDTTIKGYDRSAGKVVRRSIYKDKDGKEYVSLGSYATSDPDACVPKTWFCKKVFGNQYLVTSRKK